MENTSGPITAQDFAPEQFLATPLQNHLNDTINEAANAKSPYSQEPVIRNYVVSASNG